MSPAEAFRTVAAYYEVLSDNDARLAREGPFLAECLDQAPGRRVLDLACGSGIHAAFYASLGAEVTAIDLSPEMVAHARALRPGPGITYAVADMREPPGGQPWDLVICLGNSLSLLPSLPEVRRAFHAAAANLTPGGLMAVQVLNYAAAAAKEPRHRVERRTTPERRITAIKSLVPDNGRTFLTLAFFAEESGGLHHVSDASVLLHLFRDDLEDTARAAGLEVAGEYGGFDKAPYRPETSPDLVLVFRNLGA